LKFENSLDVEYWSLKLHFSVSTRLTTSPPCSFVLNRPAARASAGCRKIFPLSASSVIE
jgi:hypothetical protein